MGTAAGAAAIDGPLPIGDIIGAAIIIGIIIVEARGKKGKERIRDTGLQDMPDEIIRQKARDRSLPPHERERYKREEKARAQRNKKKRTDAFLLNNVLYRDRERSLNLVFEENLSQTRRAA
ncbi:MAG: hypothetical protein ACUVSV_13495 [Armatimonadota bacterium]